MQVHYLQGFRISILKDIQHPDQLQLQLSFQLRVLSCEWLPTHFQLPKFMLLCCFPAAPGKLLIQKQEGGCRFQHTHFYGSYMAMQSKSQTYA